MKHYSSSTLKTICDVLFAIDTFRTLLWVTLFSIGFGMVEAAVVIYTRALYFPDGFQFPINAIADPIVFTELWREFATLLMLAAVGIIAGKNKVQRFAYFLISFAVWDIFYYVFLKVFIDWPANFMTWDILFLLPVAWIGPVIAPIILAILMIGIGLMLIIKNTPLNTKSWLDNVRVKELPSYPQPGSASKIRRGKYSSGDCNFWFNLPIEVCHSKPWERGRRRKILK